MSRTCLLAQQLLTLGTGLRCQACRTHASTVVCVDCIAEVRSSPVVPGAAFHDRGAIGRLVRRAKRGDWRAGARVLATVVVADRPAVVPRCDVVTWVPADGRRRARRGGHLPERFARALARRLDVPAVELLRRTDRRPPQRGLGRDERRRNVAGAFVPTRHGRSTSALPAATRVLVVDDVRTTGATLAAARAALDSMPCVVETLAIVGVDSAIDGQPRCLELRSERGKAAHESNDACR